MCFTGKKGLSLSHCFSARVFIMLPDDRKFFSSIFRCVRMIKKVLFLACPIYCFFQMPWRGECKGQVLFLNHCGLF